MKNYFLIVLFLRISIASVFLYAAVASTLEPDNWIGYLPQFLRNIIPAKQLLLGFSVYELTLSFWVLSGWKSFFAGIVSSFTLTGIIISNLGTIDIVFRDIAILFSAVALTISGYPNNILRKKK